MSRENKRRSATQRCASRATKRRKVHCAQPLKRVAPDWRERFAEQEARLNMRFPSTPIPDYPSDTWSSSAAAKPSKLFPERQTLTTGADIRSSPVPDSHSIRFSSPPTTPTLSPASPNTSISLGEICDLLGITLTVTVSRSRGRHFTLITGNKLNVSFTKYVSAWKREKTLTLELMLKQRATGRHACFLLELPPSKVLALCYSLSLTSI